MYYKVFYNMPSDNTIRHIYACAPSKQEAIQSSISFFAQHKPGAHIISVERSTKREYMGGE